MTQPSLDQTFDTSLIDLRDNNHADTDTDPRLTGSFSTTDTDTSDYEQRAKATIAAMEARQYTRTADDTPKAQHHAQFSADTKGLGRVTASPIASSASAFNTGGGQSKPQRVTRYLSTVDAYNQWASVYDTDGNILQVVDDLELESVLPEMLSLVTKHADERMTVLDVGCGTGRNTAKLLTYHWPSNLEVTVTGLEMSSGMLEVAEKKLRPMLSSRQNLALNLLEIDAFGRDLPADAPLADALISTLVLEHVELDPFFQSLASLLRPGGYAVVTNMHQEMGLQSQAGFVAEDGTKVRGTSWAHSTEDTKVVAEQHGFEIVGTVKERGVDADMVGSVLGHRGKKWIGYRVWYGMILRKRS